MKREGNVDFSAIVEGARRVRNKLQEDGFFFAEVTQTCTVSNPPPDLGPNGTPGDLREPQSDSVNGPQHKHRVSGGAGRRFRLTDIRITGTERLAFEDVEADLKSQRRTPLV